MRPVPALRPALCLAPLLVLAAACVNEPAAAPALPPLAADRAAPALALAEHVLAAHFADEEAADPPTTCLTLSPDPLDAAQEAALIARFPRLAPRARCATAPPPPPSDGMTGERAVVVQIYRFACTDATHCTGWAIRPGRPATRYTMAYQNGAWRIEGDRRLLAQ